jgi:methyl-accepting chemotaxis protein
MAKKTHRYDWYGALLGAGLPIAGTVIEALGHLGSMTPGALWRAHASQPLLWIMDTTPLVLGALGRRIVQQHRDLVHKSEEIVRLEQVRRESFDRTASELFHAARGLLGNVSEFTSTTAETAASVRETTATMNQLSQTASAAALTAETVIGLAMRSERASEVGLRHAEASSAELLRIADEVRGLSTRMEGLSGRVRDLLDIAAVVGRLAERSERVSGEAARAAERAGAGAADLQAIAAEVRGHAEEAQRAAGQVRQILAEVQRAIVEVASAAESGGTRATAGAKLASETG